VTLGIDVLPLAPADAVLDGAERDTAVASIDAMAAAVAGTPQ
jgi:hypothetical protein